MEFSLLGLPVGKAGEPISRIKILEAIWSDTPDRHADTRVVDVQVARLASGSSRVSRTQN
jgi:DNA-binding response OmpR family regulator